MLINKDRLTWGRFHQHCMLSFSLIFYFRKNTNTNSKKRKAAQNRMYGEDARKMLVKSTQAVN